MQFWALPWALCLRRSICSSQYRKKQVVLTEADRSIPADSTSATLKQLLKLAVPITIGSAGLQIFNALDTMIIQGRLQDAIGLTVERSNVHVRHLFRRPDVLYAALGTGAAPGHQRHSHGDGSADAE